VRQIFAEEHLAYEIDDAGGVRPRVDREFQSNIASALAGLQSQRYQNVRELFENALRNLNSGPPNYKQAWRATLSAVEGLFGLMFPYARLTPMKSNAACCPSSSAHTKATRPGKEPRERCWPAQASMTPLRYV
jgi:hypothetical protein